jgi:hypothetical protein
MSDLKTFWQAENQPMPEIVDLSGDLAVKRGSDPNITDAEQETANSVSGLPLQPSRMVSTEQNPEIPTLEDRRPGTIDKR